MKIHHRALWHALGELLDPTGAYVERVPELSDEDWPPLYRLAAGQLVAPALYATLAGRGRLDQVPSEVRHALATLHALNDARNRRLRAVLRETVQVLNRAGIEPILLKGAIALLPDQYPHAFARMMGDLDLGVEPTETERADDALRAVGYYGTPYPDPAPWTSPCQHLAPLFHPSGNGNVEIHQALLCDRVPTAALSLPMVRTHAQALEWDGLRVQIPALEHRLLHNALHHQLQDQAFDFDRRSLRQLLEFAQLRALPTAVALDWPERLRHLDAVGFGVGDAVRGYLLAAQDLFGQPLPAGVRPTVAALRAELRFAFRLDHPRWGQQRERLARLRRHLRNLPRRLLTPAWYPAKYRHLRQQWFPPRPSRRHAP